MSLIPWREEFELGITEIDEQHKKILAIINKMHDLFSDKEHENEQEVDAIIQELIDYAGYHFGTEEKYLKLFGYEKLEEHLSIHEQYRSKVADWQTCYKASRDKIVFFEISNFLQEWWTWHILNTDRAYVPFLKSNGLS